MTNTASEWKATAGCKAWFVDGNVTVVRVYEKSGTATIQYWGRALAEGKLVTHRGVSLRSLKPPRKFVGLVDGKKVYAEQEVSS